MASPATSSLRCCHRSPRHRLATALVVLLMATGVATGCSADPGSTAPSSPGADGSADTGSGSTASDTSYPDVEGVEVSDRGDGRFDFDVTISSPYDTPEQYADGWRILTPDGDLLGEHTLTHDHATEQPFTRTQSGVEIPTDVGEVIVEGRDQANGYGGATQTVELPGR